MPQSLSILRANESALADALLPEEPEPTKGLDERDRFLTHAYLVLASAVIEEFIEGLFREYISRCADASKDRVAACFVSLAAKFADDIIGQNKGAVPRAADAVPALSGLYESKVIKPNNGVKRANVLSLSKPLGIADRLEEECEPLLSAADSLGAKRGRVAHLGTLDEEIRPTEARTLVTAVLDELNGLVAVLQLTHADDAAPNGARTQ